MGVRAVLLASALVAVLALGFGGAPARAAGPPPTLKVEVIGKGKVTGLGINCGLGSLSCFTAYGSSTTSVTLKASPAPGWTFSGWEDDCSSSGTGTCALTPPTGDQVATAVFTTASAVQTSTFGVSLASTPNGGVSESAGNYPIDCSGSTTECSLTVLQGSTITVVQQPDSGFFFAGWGGACSGKSVACSAYLTSDKTVTASWINSTAQNTLEVTVAGNGTVTGGGLNCGAGSTCDVNEPANSSFTLTATPASGYAFTGWDTDCAGSQPTCTVQMNDTRTVVANFDPLVPFTLTVSGNGTVSGDGVTCGPGPQTCTGAAAPNTSATFTATPQAGGNVIWSGNCNSTAGPICTVDGRTTAFSVTATFSGGTTPPIATNSLSTSVVGDGYITATSGTASIYCTAAGGAGCSANVQANTTLTLTAVPASGTSGGFTSWTGACAAFTTTTCTLTMSTAKSTTANFAGDNTTYVLTAQPTGNGTITGAGLHCLVSGSSGCSGPQAAGASVTIIATPSSGSSFSGWGGACSGTSSSCTVSMSSAKTVTATFGALGVAKQSLSIAVTGAGQVVAPGGDCTSTAGKSNACAQEYAPGSKVTLTAKPAKGYVLAGWTGACAGAKTTCTVTLSSAQTVGATFTRPVLSVTHKPTVVHTKTGYRITLWFHAGVRGTAAVVATRSGKTVVRRKVAEKPGGRRILVTVQARGTYVLTLTLAKHSLRWRVKV